MSSTDEFFGINSLCLTSISEDGSCYPICIPIHKIQCIYPIDELEEKYMYRIDLGIGHFTVLSKLDWEKFVEAIYKEYEEETDEESEDDKTQIFNAKISKNEI